MLFRKPPSILGVDIGTTSIKIVELQKKGKKIQLKNYGEYQTPVSQIETTPIGANFLAFPEDRIALLIKEIMKEAKIEIREANIALPVFSSFFTVIELPLMEPEEIPEAVKFQAGQYIPVPIEEVVLDWSIIEEENPIEKKIKVLLTAVPKDVIQKYINIGRNVNLTIKTLEVESFAQVRALVGNNKEPFVLVDIGGRNTGLTIVDGGFIRLCYNLEFSSFSFTKIIAQKFNISVERAEIFQREKGLKGNIGGMNIAAILPAIDKMIFGIERAINTYLLHNPKKEIKKIILLGGGARMPGLVSYINTKLNKEVVIGNPFFNSNIEFPPILKTALEEIGPSFTTAIGLALREFEEK